MNKEELVKEVAKKAKVSKQFLFSQPVKNSKSWLTLNSFQTVKEAFS